MWYITTTGNLIDFDTPVDSPANFTNPSHAITELPPKVITPDSPAASDNFGNLALASGGPENQEYSLEEPAEETVQVQRDALPPDSIHGTEPSPRPQRNRQPPARLSYHAPGQSVQCQPITAVTRPMFPNLQEHHLPVNHGFYTSYSSFQAQYPPTYYYRSPSLPVPPYYYWPSPKPIVSNFAQTVY